MDGYSAERSPVTGLARVVRIEVFRVSISTGRLSRRPFGLLQGEALAGRGDFFVPSADLEAILMAPPRREAAMAVLGICRRCGAALERHVCSRCDGSGLTRFLLIFPRECPTCRGTGNIVRCPNQGNHFRYDPDPFQPSTLPDLEKERRDQAEKHGAFDQFTKRNRPGGP